jgi:hypothetical protein
MNPRYWRRRERDALLRRLEMAVETGVLSAHDAVETFRREAWQVDWFFRHDFWRAFSRLYNRWYYRIGLEMGFPSEAAARIGPEMDALRKRLGRDLRYKDVQVLLWRLLMEDYAERSEGIP